MGLLDNFRNKIFWINVLKLGTVFFVLFIFISLIISHFAALSSGDFNAIYEDEWAEGRWREYFLIKLTISFVYAVYMVSRKMSREKRS